VRKKPYALRWARIALAVLEETEELEQIDRLALAGPIPKVQLYRTFAEFCAARADREGQEHFAALGLSTAEAAGLDHQARRLRAEVQGPTVNAEPSGIPARSRD
jgi:hypothetical protein